MDNDPLQLTRDDGQLCVVFRGSWTRDTAQCDPDTLLAEIGDLGTLKIDASAVKEWDSKYQWLKGFSPFNHFPVLLLTSSL